MLTYKSLKGRPVHAFGLSIRFIQNASQPTQLHSGTVHMPGCPIFHVFTKKRLQPAWMLGLLRFRGWAINGLFLGCFCASEVFQLEQHGQSTLKFAV